MAKHEEGVLTRWSRLKREHAEQADSPPSEDVAAASAPLPAASDAGAGAEEGADAVRLEDLPDIETLTYESDFSVFMAKGVPKAIRNQALKKLWRSHPVLANLDGLNDYDLDYRPSEIRALAARAAEDLARGTKPRPTTRSCTCSRRSSATPSRCSRTSRSTAPSR
jgi:Protein of unknown function (DUF3306)